MTVDWKKKLIPNLPYLLFVYLFDKLCQAVRLAPGLDASEKFLHLSQGFTEAFSSGLPSLHPLDLLAGIAGAVIVRLAVYAKGKNARKYRKGIEYGSARWGTAADIAPYVDPVPDWNIPLTQTEKLTMSSRPKNPKYARNKNILVIGGSGSGKTRFFVKPSLMQMHSSYVVTDPKGQLLSEVGTMLRRGAPKLDENGKPMRDARGKIIYEPYRIKVLNTINFKKSMKYNPFAYIRSEKDILKLVNVIIANTKGDGEKSSEDFWVKAERLLYCALIGYIWYEAEPEEKNFLTLLELINASEAREDDEEFQSPVDLLFAKLEKEHPDHFAVKQYRKFKLAAGKTLKSILISCGARLAPFDIAELREIMSDDELELDTLGDRKTALFLIMSDTDTTFNFVIAMLQSQLFNLLCDKADDVYGGRLPVHVRCLLDEFANIGQIPNFDKLIATIRSREISASIILQSQSQLKTIYKDAADTIVGNCDTTLFLGGKEKSTLKEISELLGKETIDSFNQSENRGIQNWRAERKLKPWRDAAKAEQAAVKANADFYYRKAVAENPQLASNPISRLWQKRKLQKQYAAAYRAAGKTAQAGKTAEATAKAAKKTAQESKRTALFLKRHWKGALIVGGIGLLLVMLLGSLQSCSSMFGGGVSNIMASSYLSEDSDMLAAEEAYCAKEDELREYLDTYEATHDYDEYHFDLDEIEHDP